MLKDFLIAVSLVFLSVLLFITFIYAKDELAKIRQEQTKRSQCVDKLIAKGIERRDIATSNGDCWYEINGYYK